MKLATFLCAPCLAWPKKKKKQVHEMPLLLGAPSEEKQSENEIDDRILAEVKDILRMTINLDEKAKLLARRMQNERAFAAGKDKRIEKRIEKLIVDNTHLSTANDGYEKEIVSPAREKATIEYVEKMCGYGFDAYLAESKIPPEPYEYSKQRRIETWIWMLKNRNSDYRIRSLLEKMTKNEKGPIGIEQFAQDIAQAYSVLSDLIFNYFANKVGQSRGSRDLKAEKSSNNALRILLSTVTLEEPSKYIVE